MALSREKMREYMRKRRARERGKGGVLQSKPTGETGEGFFKKLQEKRKREEAERGNDWVFGGCYMIREKEVR